MSRIVAVRKDETGRITDYKLDNGKVLSHDRAVIETNAGTIEGCSTFTTRDGDTGIRSNRGQNNYKLSDLPNF